MKCKVILNKQGLGIIDNNTKIALMKATDAILTEIMTDQVIPFDTGYMQNDSTFADFSQLDKGKTAIVTNAPYAERLYFHPEYDFQTINNPNASGRWFDSWIKPEILEMFFLKFYK